MAEVEFSKPYHPTNPDTGEELPTRTEFKVPGVGMGLAEVHHAKDDDGNYIFRLPEVRLIFTPLSPPDLSETETVDVRFIDPTYTSLEVVTTPALLRPKILEHLGV